MCVPVLNIREAAVHPHNVARGTYVPTAGSSDGSMEPAPAPKLSRTPGYAPRPNPVPGGDTRSVLAEIGLNQDDIGSLMSKGAAAVGEPRAKL